MTKKDRNLYLTNKPLQEAMEEYLHSISRSFAGISDEIIMVQDALGRKTASPVFAKISAPHYNAAAMDGIAVDASVTNGASETNPIQLKIDKDYTIVNTGAPLTMKRNAVVMVEDIVEVDDETVEIRSAVSPWQHVRPVGEDVVKGELILSENHIIRPQDIAALLTGGIERVKVKRKISVGIIPTGSEITELVDPLPEGKIIESNSKMFYALLSSYEATGTTYPIVKDEPAEIRLAIEKAVDENDLVVVNAGSSAGTKDYTVDVLREIGVVFTHGIAIKPGKPAILAEVKGKPVVGIPGYPVSAYVVFEQVVKSLVYALQNQKPMLVEKLKATLARRIVSSLKHEEFVRVKVGKVDERWIATPLNRGAGVTMSLVKADGILRIPQLTEGYDKGDSVEVELSRSQEDLSNTIVSIGSHDIVMDLIANELQKKNDNLALSSAHVGSMGGIIAMKQKECHLAPIHLLDEISGEYNIEYVRKYFANEKMSMIKLVKRSQGLMVQQGNPKEITSLEDLGREDISMINRQKGAGTRILLDYMMKIKKMDPNLLQGYQREMTTHMAVAVAIKNDTADCGLGVESAAKAMGLDFIPIAWEEYDLLIPQYMLETEKIKRLLEVIRSDSFVKQVMRLGGYDCSQTGKTILI
ncbi:molybdopterin biosynthesis protein [Tindallia californiensis]|uniref:Molybdopterin molybdenumtransferase n=1 Tax=Tindallia californiensis TaxID=159292 RepID=A0A1H3IEQ4_9FIRM|nr:molybdopterin biosynthesis protein [Tindallia californiensis]SDY26087.1 molybdopterin molybdochelatase [Tindallia californiensis]